MPLFHHPARFTAKAAALAALIMGASTSCVSAQDADVPPDLLGKWQAEIIDGNPVSGDAASIIEFEEAGAVDGNGGCNTLFGPISRSGAFVKIGPLAMTRKACAPDVLKQEAAFVKALEATRDFRRDQGATALLLLNAQGKELMRLSLLD
ncbi:META domain-containing protein [Roseibium litorale]|uniref:META domain-containing protein n=1 Tax=Roseibium litorale TaxID=2803841 RepID=A0ABR9CGM7_9HYPH|nr:META domain-containing protein [Roseibium litorale]MBD8889938.1 META domain-containing protein [Roseibium litorale]